MGSGDYSSPGESRSLRPLLNLASPSPAKQRISIAQIGSSGTGSALLTVETEAGVGVSESGGGAKSPRSRMGWVESNAVWPIALAGAVSVARASAAPSAKDIPRAQTMIFADEACPEPLLRR